MLSVSENVHYESGTSSVRARTCSTNQEYHHYDGGCTVQQGRLSCFGRGGLFENSFQ